MNGRWILQPWATFFDLSLILILRQGLKFPRLALNLWFSSSMDCRIFSFFKKKKSPFYMSSRQIAFQGQQWFNFSEGFTGLGEGRKAKNRAEARAPSVALPTGRGESGHREEQSWWEPDAATTQAPSLAVHQLPGHWLLTLATKTRPPTACGHPAECFHRIVLLKLCLNDAMETNHAQCVFPSSGFPNGQVINSNASEPAQFCFSISAKLTGS